MEHLVAARNLINELVAGEHLELRRADVVGRDLAQLVDELERPPSGRELEEWLEQHRLVSECYAGAALLDELVLRHFGRALAAAPIVAREARHAELERHLREAPEDPEPHLVYSDWLQEQSDPLGELIALGVAATCGGPVEAERFERHLKQQGAHFLGTIARLIPERVSLSWRHGLVRGIRVLGKIDPASWEELLRLRVCELVGSLETDQAWSEEIDAVIAASAPASLRTLTLAGCAGGTLPRALLGRELDRLVLVGDRLSLGPGSLPGTLAALELRVRNLARPDAARGERPSWPLRELHVDLGAEAAAFLAGVEVPRLERLGLDLQGARSSRLLPGLLRSLDLPALRQLSIQGARDDPRACAAAGRGRALLAGAGRRGDIAGRSPTSCSSPATCGVTGATVRAASGRASTWWRSRWWRSGTGCARAGPAASRTAFASSPGASSRKSSSCDARNSSAPALS